MFFAVWSIFDQRILDKIRFCQQPSTNHQISPIHRVIPKVHILLARMAKDNHSCDFINTSFASYLLCNAPQIVKHESGFFTLIRGMVVVQRIAKYGGKGASWDRSDDDGKPLFYVRLKILMKINGVLVN